MQTPWKRPSLNNFPARITGPDRQALTGQGDGQGGRIFSILPA